MIRTSSRFLPMWQFCVGLSFVMAVMPLAAYAQPPAPESFPLLMTELSEVHGFRAEFHEEKHISLLAIPLVNEGTIHFTHTNGGRGRMARQTLQPERSTVLITDNEMRVGTQDDSRVIQLEEAPLVRSFVDAFMGMFRGDRAAIEHSYVVDYQVEETAWTVSLTPKLDSVARLIREIEVRGHGSIIDHLTVAQTNGDRSETQFTHVNTHYHYTDEELHLVFRLQDP